MKLVVFVCMLSIASAQTTLRLRYGGPESAFRITGISSSTPAVATVRNIREQAGHTLTDGESVYIHSVMGCQAANGYRKVKSVDQVAGTFALTDIDGSDLTCDAPFSGTFGTGWVGKVGDVVLNATGPRIFLPQSGENYTFATDPDGAGPLVSPMAQANGPAWQGLFTGTASLLDTACDGFTKSTCPNIAAKMGNPYNDNLIDGYDLKALAMIWYGDNSKLQHLNALKYVINHVEELGFRGAMGGSWVKINNFPTDESAVNGGHSSGTDWLSIMIGNISASYDLVRTQFTEAEKQAFSKKILNGWDGSPCKNSMVFKTGTVSIVAGSKAVVGTNTTFLADFVVGQAFYAKGASPTTTGNSNIVASIADDTHMTLTYNSAVTWPAAKYAAAAVTWEDDMCGALAATSTHVEYLGGPIVPRAGTNLTAAIDATATTIPSCGGSATPSARRS